MSVKEIEAIRCDHACDFHWRDDDGTRVTIEVSRYETDLIDNIRTQLEWHDEGTRRRTLNWLADYFSKPDE